MLILLDCRPLQKAGSDRERSRFIWSVAAALSRKEGIEWLLLMDHRYKAGSVPDLPASSTLLVERALPGRAGWRLWYDWQIPRLAQKHKVDLIMLTGGTAAGQVRAPQLIWMPARTNPEEMGSRQYDQPLYLPRLEESMRRAESVFCFSEKDRVWLGEAGRTGTGKVIALWPSPSEGLYISDGPEREMVKTEYANGKEFFFADVTGADEEGVLTLLRAFSLFKKRQLSNLQLVIAGEKMRGIMERLGTYKYRKDLHWHRLTDEASKRCMAAAYAALLLFDGESLGRPVHDAWKTGVPVIVHPGGRLLEIAGNAALSTGDGNAAGLAGAMMSLYKDEALRSNLIARGFSRLGELGSHPPAAQVWSAIGGMQIIN
jgi:glycosyltransferase involved in cell wall biosynthesis